MHRAASLIAGEESPSPDHRRAIVGGRRADRRLRLSARMHAPARLRPGRSDSESGTGADDTAATVARLNAAAIQLRQRRRARRCLHAAARSQGPCARRRRSNRRARQRVSRPHAGGGVHGAQRDFVAARYAAAHRIPIIYRVQPQDGRRSQLDAPAVRIRSTRRIGLDFYAQLRFAASRRYADLVMQRQLLGALANRDHDTAIYTVDELLTVLAGAENAEASGRELERREALLDSALPGASRPRRPNSRLRRTRRPKRRNSPVRGARNLPWRRPSATNPDGAGRTSIHYADGSHSIHAPRRSLNRRNQNRLIFCCHPERS